MPLYPSYTLVSESKKAKVNTLDLIPLSASEANEKLLNISTGEMNHGLPGPIQREIAPIWDLQPLLM